MIPKMKKPVKHAGKAFGKAKSTRQITCSICSVAARNSSIFIVSLPSIMLSGFLCVMYCSAGYVKIIEVLTSGSIWIIM